MNFKTFALMVPAGLLISAGVWADEPAPQTAQPPVYQQPNVPPPSQRYIPADPCDSCGGGDGGVVIQPVPVPVPVAPAPQATGQYVCYTIPFEACQPIPDGYGGYLVPILPPPPAQPVFPVPYGGPPVVYQTPGVIYGGRAPFYGRGGYPRAVVPGGYNRGFVGGNRGVVGAAPFRGAVGAPRGFVGGGARGGFHRASAEECSIQQENNGVTTVRSPEGEELGRSSSTHSYEDAKLIKSKLEDIGTCTKRFSTPTIRIRLSISSSNKAPLPRGLLSPPPKSFHRLNSHAIWIILRAQTRLACAKKKGVLCASSLSSLFSPHH